VKVMIIGIMEKIKGNRDWRITFRNGSSNYVMNISGNQKRKIICEFVIMSEGQERFINDKFYW